MRLIASSPGGVQSCPRRQVTDAFPAISSEANAALKKAVLALALILGAYLRFAGLGALEMSADEGASWAAAAAPSASEVLRLQARLNPGKLGLHDLALHVWMRVFGDSLGAMRALSAALGTAAIAILFFAAREILQIRLRPSEPTAGSAQDSASGPMAALGDTVAASAVLVFAVNLVTIKYSREARMYSLALVLILAQVWMFLRTLRRGGFGNYAGSAIFTALAIATHLTAASVFGAEGLWLIYLLMRNRFSLGAPESRGALTLILAIGGAAAVLFPFVPRLLHSSERAVAIGAINWIEPPQVWAPFALFNKASGSFAFPAMAVLAAWGVIRGWSWAKGAVLFALIWMFVPPFAVLAASYAIRPIFVERYLLSCFAPFFILVAIGAWEVRVARAGRIAPICVLALVTALALGHMGSYNRKPHDAQWGEAVAVAAANVASGGSIAVAPGYAVNVVAYYLRRTAAIPPAYPYDGASGASVVIVGDQSAPSLRAQLAREYPHPLAQLRGVVVRHR
jgi:mannosyltransferase